MYVSTLFPNIQSYVQTKVGNMTIWSLFWTTKTWSLHLLLKDTCYTWRQKTAVFYILLDIFMMRPSFKNLRSVFWQTLTPLFPSVEKLSKNAPRIFDTSCINKFWWNLASCIAGILNQNTIRYYTILTWILSSGRSVFRERTSRAYTSG